MAECTKFIRADLSDSGGAPYPGGGVWTYLGYSTVEGGPYTDTPATPLVPYAKDAVIPEGDDFELVTGGVTTGYYAFQYDQGGQTYTSLIGIFSGIDCAGVDSDKIYSSSDATVYDLSTFLDGTGCPTHTTGGAWENIDSAPGFSAPNFTPSTAGVGIWRFRYYLQDTGYEAYEDCEDCNVEALITVEVTADFRVFITTADTTCQYTAAVDNPSDSVANKANVSIDDDDFFPSFEFRKVVDSDCEDTDCTVSIVASHPDTGVEDNFKLVIAPNYLASDILYNAAFLTCNDEVAWINATTTNSKFASTHNYMLGFELEGFQTGGYIDRIQMTENNNGVETNFWVPCAPSGANQATFSGSGGTTDATALTFDDTLPGNFSAAIAIAIRNELIDNRGYSEAETEGTTDEFFLAWDTSSYSGGDGRIAIRFTVKHQPTGIWAGLKTSAATVEADFDGIAGVVAYTYADPEMIEEKLSFGFSISSSFPVGSKLSNCSEANLQIESTTSTPLIDVSDYDTIIWNASNAAVGPLSATEAVWSVPNTGSPTSMTCTDQPLVNSIVVHNAGQVLMNISNTQRLYDGGTFTSLTIRSTTMGNIVIPLSPSTATLSATCDECSTNIQANHLEYSEVNGHIFANSIRLAAVNYLHTQGYTYGTDYEFVSSTWDNINHAIDMRFRARHNPTNEWLGIDTTTSALSYVDGNGGVWISISGTPVAFSAFLSFDYIDTPCPSPGNKLFYVTEGVAHTVFLDEANINYDNIPLDVSTVTFTINSGSSNLTEDCDGKTLTAATINCGGSVTYLWAPDGDTTAVINKRVGSGTHTVTATCTSPAESDDESVTI